MLPNAGDELQGIKRGIMELADALVINKADGESVNLARLTCAHYQNAMNLLVHAGFWKPRVMACSALEQHGVSEVWQMIDEYRQSGQENGQFARKRARQNSQWLTKLLHDMLEQKLQENAAVKVQMPALEQKVIASEITPYAAAKTLIELVFASSE